MAHRLSLLAGVVEMRAREAEGGGSRVEVRLILIEAGTKLKGPNNLRPASSVTSVASRTPTETIRVMPNDLLSTIKGNGSTKHLATGLSASLSMSASMAADDRPPAPTIIPVHCAAISHMGLQTALTEDVFPIVTKLKADAWEIALRDAGLLDEFIDIPLGLRDGFLCGLENFSLACTFIPPNHFTSAEDEDFVAMKYAEEIELGRISRGYDPDFLFSLIGHFRTAPLAVIDQGGGKRRVIVNHSYPRNKQHCINLENLTQEAHEGFLVDPTRTSINTVIDSKRFQCAWGSFSECYLLVADAPEGSEAAVFDVDAAFRNIPTHPSARRFLAISIKGLIHIDHVLNFGASPSPGIFGRVADAMVGILLHGGVDAVMKWVDDFIFIRYPSGLRSDGTYDFTYSATLIWDIAERLGWPWAPAKFVDFSTAFMYIGFLWDLRTKKVELPEKKKKKYLDRISGWTHGSLHTMKEAEIVIGTLNHVCLVVPEGRSHLVSLYKFRGGFKTNKASLLKHKLSVATSEDMAWWNQRLQADFVGMNIIRPPKPLATKLFVDASTTWGIGLVLDGKWLAWKLRDGWNSEGREIGWAEMVAVELAVRTLVTGKFFKSHIIVRSDNQGVVGALKAGRSRGPQQNLILREIVRLIQDHNMWISSTWVPTLENPADGPSRGLFPDRSSLYAFPPRIPFHLTGFVHRSVDFHDPALC